ncbi:MAG: 3-hydroxyacyl-CoA dehydrogenase NAD-binding domain-containing protein [Mariprofundales bacterium]
MEVVSLIQDAQGEARLLFARNDQSVNTLDANCMQQLADCITELEQVPPRILILESGLDGCFIAGVDVDVIGSVNDANTATDLARLGQSLCLRLERLSCTTVAVVNGFCLGGGLEIALSCNFIIAIHEERTKFALPEIKLGIHPGFGGCVRLPRRVGWLKATELILSGRILDAKKAKRLGIVDLTCYKGQEQAAIDWLINKYGSKHTAKQPVWRELWLQITPLRRLFFQQVRKKAAVRFSNLNIHQAYPAIDATINLLQELVVTKGDAAYRLEAESLGRMAVTATCNNLVRVFHLGENLKHQEAVKSGNQAAKDIKHTAVFGSGVMGSGIAWLATKAIKSGDLDTSVDLHDITPEAITHGLKSLRRVAKREPERLQYVRPCIDDNGLDTCQVVIEAIVENLEIKRSLFARLEEKMPNDALILTNTSSLSVSVMQQGMQYPQRVVGMHFFNPVPKMPLVEVIRGEQSDEASVQAVCALAVRWGKYPVVCADAPGFIVNRCLMPYMAAVLSLLDAGQKVVHIDGALKRFGMPMGGLELADRVGLDICMHVGNHLAPQMQAAINKKEPETDNDSDDVDNAVLPIWLEKMVADGVLGAKTGRGFFIYNKNNKCGEVNPDLAKYGLADNIKKTNAAQGIVSNIDTHESSVMDDLRLVDRCLFPMLFAALQCLHEKVANSADEIDAAMIYGAGFPAFRGGLLHYFSNLPHRELVRRAERVGLQVPKEISLLYSEDVVDTKEEKNL